MGRVRRCGKWGEWGDVENLHIDPLPSSFWGTAITEVDRVTGVVFAVPWRGADFGSLADILLAFGFHVKKYVLLVFEGTKARYGSKIYAGGGCGIHHVLIFGCC